MASLELYINVVVEMFDDGMMYKKMTASNRCREILSHEHQQLDRNVSDQVDK